MTGRLRRALFDQPVAAYLMLALAVLAFGYYLQEDSRNTAERFNRERATTSFEICQKINEKSLDPLRDIIGFALQPVPVPPNATPQQRAELEDRQRRTAEFRDFSFSRLTPLDCHAIVAGGSP